MTASAVDSKVWAMLLARAAIAGFQLWRTDPADGVPMFFVARWGMVRALSSIEEVERLLCVVGAPA